VAADWAISDTSALATTRLAFAQGAEIPRLVSARVAGGNSLADKVHRAALRSLAGTWLPLGAKSKGWSRHSAISWPLVGGYWLSWRCSSSKPTIGLRLQ
jgi:hypothetical protein